MFVDLVLKLSHLTIYTFFAVHLNVEKSIPLYFSTVLIRPSRLFLPDCTVSTYVQQNMKTTQDSCHKKLLFIRSVLMCSSTSGALQTDHRMKYRESDSKASGAVCARISLAILVVIIRLLYAALNKV